MSSAPPAAAAPALGGLAALADATAAPGFVANPSGAVVHMGAAWRTLTGLPPSAALGHAWRDALHPDDAPAVAAWVIDRMRGGGPPAVQARLRGGDGAWRPVEVRLTPLAPAVPLWWGEVVDASDRAAQVDALPGALLTTDPAGRIRAASRGLAALSGVAPADSVGRNVLDLVDPADLPKARGLLRAAAGGDLPDPVVLRARRRTGDTIAVEVRGRAARGPSGAIEDLHFWLNDVTLREAARLRERRRHAALAAVAALADTLVRLGAADAALAEVAGRVGEALDADRVAVIVGEGPGGEVRARWHRAGVPPLPGAPAPPAPPPARLVHEAAAGRVVGGPVDRLPPDERAFFAAQGAVSVLGAPLRVEGRAGGLLYLDLVEERREWDPELVEAVRLVAGLIASSLVRERADRALRASEARMRLITDNASDVIVVGDAQGMVTWASPALARLTGRRPEDIVGTPAAGNVHADDRDALEAAVAAVRGGEEAGAVVRVAHAEAGWVWVEARLRPVMGPEGALEGFQAGLRDVGDRVAAERRARRRAEHALELVESMPEAVAVLEADGRVRRVNRRFAGLLGVGPDELVDRPLPFAWDPAGPRAELEVRARDGRRFVIADARPVPDPDGDGDVLVATFTDITVRVLAERALGRRERILDAVARAAGLLLREGADDATLGDALRLLGEAADVSRALLFEVQAGRGATTLRTRACWEGEALPPGAPPGAVAGIDLEGAGLGWLVDAYRAGRAAAAIIDEMPSGGDVLAGLGIRAFAGAPVTVGGDWWGVLAFDDCVEPREWSQAELDALETAAGVLGSVLDRARTETALDDSRARYRSLFEGVDDGVWLVDAGGRILTANPAAERLVGLPLAAQVGRSVADPDWPGHDEEGLPIPPERNAVVRALRSGRPVRGPVAGVPQPTGETVWLQLSVVPLGASGAGPAAGAVVTARDVTEQRRGEDTLRQSEAWLRILAESQTDVVMRLTPEGRMLYVSPSCEAVVGFTPEELLGHTAEELVHPDDFDAIAQALAAGRGRVTYRCRHKGGGWVWLEAEGRHVTSPGGDLIEIQAAARDVSERVAADKALRESEARSRTILETIAEGITFHDRAGTVLAANPAAERILGLAPGAMVGLGPASAGWPRFRDRSGAPVPPGGHPVEQALAGGEPVRERLIELGGPDGRWIEVSSEPLRGPDGVSGAVTTIADVTARVQAEERLRASEARFRLMAETAGDVVMRTGMDSVVVWASPSVERVLGYRPEEVVGRSAEEWIHPDDLPRVRAGEPALRAGDAALLTYRHRHREGHWVWLETAVRLAPGPDGAPEVHAASRDVSARVDAERRRREADERVRAAIDAGADALLLLDALHDGDGRPGGFVVRLVNRAAARLIGRPAEDVVGMPLAALAVPALDDGLAAALLCVAQRGEPHDDELVVADPEGGRRWLSRQAVPAPDGVVVTVRDVTMRREHEAEESALRRVATAVAGARGPDEVMGLAAQEAVALLRADASIAARRERDELCVVGAAGEGSPSVGVRVPLDAELVIAESVRTGTTLRVGGRELAGGGLRGAVGDSAVLDSVVATPIRSEGRIWGALSVAARPREAFPARAEDRLERFAALLGLAVQNAADRERLAAMAATDALTGLANHRTFHERLREECARAGRHGRPLALVLLDLDRFGRVNQALGHQAGDQVIAAAAAALAARARTGDVVARTGGEQFGWILPEVDAGQARRLAEQARAALAGVTLHDTRISASAGVCELGRAGGKADVLVALADGALYWAKAQGRDRTVVYSPDVVRERSAAERAERLERSRALAALNALARAVDAKDHSTREHSERVARVACALAGRLGWSAAEQDRLHEAALLHDVGKIGVSDLILLKPGRPTPEEFAEIHRHSAVGADIVAEALAGDQVAWVRSHHERWDGAGYPDGLGGDDIPEGARIIALADSWDAMTVARSYGRPLGRDEARAEVERCSGSQFWPEGVRALAALLEAGEL